MCTRTPAFAGSSAISVRARSWVDIAPPAPPSNKVWITPSAAAFRSYELVPLKISSVKKRMGLPRYLTDPYVTALENFAVSISGRIAIGGGVFLCGVLAHWFKQKDPLFYGHIKIFYGTASAVGIAAGLSPREALFSRWVALAGSAYVVARGLNNWSESLTKYPERYPNKTILSM